MADSRFHGPDNTTPTTPTEGKAGAYRADVSVRLDDFFNGRDGRITLYTQSLDAGYSAPGEAVLKDTQQYGGTLKMPVTGSLSFAAKGDQRTEDQGLETRAIEVDMVYKLAERWSLSSGVRDDLRKDNSPVVPLTQEQGERTDAVAQVKYDASSIWSAYGFVQQTVAGKRRPWRQRSNRRGRLLSPDETIQDRRRGSDGDLGPGGKIGTSFLYPTGPACT